MIEINEQTTTKVKYPLKKALLKNEDFNNLSEEAKAKVLELITSDRMMDDAYINKHYDVIVLAGELVDYINCKEFDRPLRGTKAFEQWIAPKYIEGDDGELVQVGDMRLYRYSTMPSTNVVNRAQDVLRCSNLIEEYPDGLRVYQRKIGGLDFYYVYNPDQCVLQCYMQKWRAEREICRHLQMPFPQFPENAPHLTNGNGGLNQEYGCWELFLEHYCHKLVEMDGYRLYRNANRYYIVEPDGLVNSNLYAYHGPVAFQKMVGEDRLKAAMGDDWMKRLWA